MEKKAPDGIIRGFFYALRFVGSLGLRRIEYNLLVSWHSFYIGMFGSPILQGSMISNAKTDHSLLGQHLFFLIFAN
jgi:hypothetical protein